MSTRITKSLITSLLAVVTLLSAQSASAEFGYDDTTLGEHYRNGSTMLEYEMYDEGIESLLKADAEHPNNADINNLLGFAHRQLGEYEKARHFYFKALKANPEHKGANEYLGELYLQTGQYAKAERQLARLASICGKCKEYKKLKKSMKRYAKS